MSVIPNALSMEPQGEVVTKATLRAAEFLGLSNKVLANILGVSSATITRMQRGDYVLRKEQKAFELAVLFVRLYRSLDAIVGGDDAIARSWLSNSNTVLGDTPLTRIQSIAGLLNVIEYLDARRAVV